METQPLLVGLRVAEPAVLAARGVPGAHQLEVKASVLGRLAEHPGLQERPQQDLAVLAAARAGLTGLLAVPGLALLRHRAAVLVAVGRQL